MDLVALKPMPECNGHAPTKPDAEYRYVFTIVPVSAGPSPHFMKTTLGRSPVPVAPLIPHG